MAWFLGRTTPNKVVHRPTCRYALTEYTWAGETTPDELVRKMQEHHAEMWHTACHMCAADLMTLITYARAAHVRSVIVEYLDEQARAQTR